MVVKPYKLVEALMHRDGLGALPLAKRMGKPKLQPQIHRFVKGEVREPARTTAAPVAAFFGIPIEAMYDEKVATETARRLGLRELPSRPEEPKKPRRAVGEPSAEVKKLASDLLEMSPAERQRLRMMMLLVSDPKHPGEAWRAPNVNAPQPSEGMHGMDSGLSPFRDEPETPKAATRPKKGSA